MLKNKTAKLAVGAALAVGGIGTVVLGAGAASAATTGTVHPEYARCTTGGTRGICTTTLWTDDLLAKDGWPITSIPGGTQINVECWYPNSTPGGDGAYDHISWTAKTGPTSGRPGATIRSTSTTRTLWRSACRSAPADGLTGPRQAQSAARSCPSIRWSTKVSSTSRLTER